MTQLTAAGGGYAISIVEATNEQTKGLKKLHVGIEDKHEGKGRDLHR